jgi:hypothetical protein
MRLLLVIAFLVVSSETLLACTGCGCRGGPGYRGPDGRCVGGKQLNSTCGTPPTSRCTYEGKSDQAAGQGPNKANVLGAPPPSLPTGPTSNTQKTRASGVGCRDQESLRKVVTCVPGASQDCEREEAALVEAATCVQIPVGISVVIEASSHSFEWLRIRVPGHPAPLWTDRRLVLER